MTWWKKLGAKEKEELIVEHLKWIKYLSSKLCWNYDNVDDAVNQGIKALLKSGALYNPNYGEDVSRAE